MDSYYFIFEVPLGEIQCDWE